jgi:acyl-CoA dehydrogenase
MARHDDDTHAHRGATLFLTPIDAPGIEIIRDVPTMGLQDFGGHVEMRYHDLRLPSSAVLGEPGQGFALAQHRLGPARLTHCMRWTGIAQRALEIATDYASRREAFGKTLAEQGAIQTMLADCDIELHAGRLMTQQAAWLLLQGERARRETSICKVFVSEAIHRVLDRAIQICGGRGYSRDLPLSAWYETARAFRIYDGASEVHRMVIARYLRRKFGATDI